MGNNFIVIASNEQSRQPQYNIEFVLFERFVPRNDSLTYQVFNLIKI